MTIYPFSLHSGSKIGLIAPAGRVFKEDILFAQKWAYNNGWELIWNKDLFRSHNLGYYYAGDTHHRLALTQEMLDTGEIDAIWCVRGGYGSVKIIDSLDFSSFLKNPKWLIGYSDITVFHNYLSNYNIASLHAITAKPLNLKYSKETYQTLAKVLKGEPLNYTLPPHSLNKKGKAKGKLVGGNLSIIYSQLGSCTYLQGENLILFIEDWCEDWYHVDRMLTAIKRSGLLERVVGVVVGSFCKMDVKEENRDYSKDFDPMSHLVIHEIIKDLDIPQLFKFPSGHIADNRALIMGAEVEMNVLEEEVNLIYL